MCLSVIWKILTAQTREEIYDSLISRWLYPEKWKGCHKWSRGTRGLLYIDQLIFNKSKSRCKNLAMVWIDYKQAYDPVPQSWKINCLQMFKRYQMKSNFIEKKHENLESVLTAGGKKLSWSKDPKRYIPRIFIIIITINYCDYASKPHAHEMQSRIQTK